MNRFVRLVPKVPNGISNSRNTFIYSDQRGFPRREEVKERGNVALVGASLSCTWVRVAPASCLHCKHDAACEVCGGS